LPDHPVPANVGLLRLELDIDADVYPELYATLTSLVSDASRGERLRQLAAAGLVWEKLRIRGQAALHGVAPEPAWATAPGAAPLPAPAARAPRGTASSRTSAAARGPAPAPVAAEPPRSAPPGFVDLALDAAPVPEPAPLHEPAPSMAPASAAGPEWAATPAVPPSAPSSVRTAARSTAPSRSGALSAAASAAPSATPSAAPPAASIARRFPVAEPWPPVLMDVVEPQAYGAAMPVSRETSRARAQVEAPVPADNGRSAPPPAAGIVEVRTPHATPLSAAALPPGTLPQAMDELRDATMPAPEPVVEHRSSTRSRLLRMKEKGLFKNG
jgi:hypothetical protein